MCEHVDVVWHNKTRGTCKSCGATKRRHAPPEYRVRLELPIPPSANVYWRHDRGVTHLSKAAKDYKEQVGWAWMADHAASQGFDCPVSVTLTCYMKYPRKGDLSNLEKVLLDSLQGYAFQDDNLVHELHMFPRYEKGRPRVEVSIQAGRS